MCSLLNRYSIIEEATGTPLIRLIIFLKKSNIFSKCPLLVSKKAFSRFLLEEVKQNANLKGFPEIHMVNDSC